ncbi:class I SAM-dependent methyltransferase [Paenibacillus pasadenensis]|uniref:class I SAM-dependent methyltransferase n=1 Tax=Paenibacillus pasadenensis TaxID=217090 RepID=UPI00203AD31A|nr:class I SAM-dependent methyltransferase [Paenibacillus pasadenensis]MCM3747914.1 class I SAM-dependent methyltransferase [Paenibacillus pasadenensis]
MAHYSDINRLNWNDRTAVHAKSAFYNIEAFLAGENSLPELDREELGDVAGLSMLHLQCHFGKDSLSWARMGARVTGVDFSDEVIDLARSLNTQLGLDARFIRSDIYNAAETLQGEQFDIVYTSYGVLCWLPDLKGWADLIGAALKPGGTFYMAESHPLAGIFEAQNDRLEMRYPYFDNEALRCESATTYTGDPDVLEHPVTYQWQHTLGDIVSALAGAGLTLEFLHEHPFTEYNAFPGTMIQDERGKWRLRENNCLPLLFSIKAVKR